MPHGAIFGMTTSGKTYLAQQLAKSYMKNGIRTFILHKPREPWPVGAVYWQTALPELFLTKLHNEKEGVAFVEFADGKVDKYDVRFHDLFTSKRHDGFRCYFLSQRAAQVHPAIRENIEQLYMFRVGSTKGAAEWAEEFGEPALLNSPTLPMRCFYHIPYRGSSATLRTLTIEKKVEKRTRQVTEKVA